MLEVQPGGLLQVTFANVGHKLTVIAFVQFRSIDNSVVCAEEVTDKRKVKLNKKKNILLFDLKFLCFMKIVLVKYMFEVNV